MPEFMDVLVGHLGINTSSDASHDVMLKILRKRGLGSKMKVSPSHSTRTEQAQDEKNKEVEGREVR